MSCIETDHFVALHDLQLVSSPLSSLNLVCPFDIPVVSLIKVDSSRALSIFVAISHDSGEETSRN